MNPFLKTPGACSSCRYAIKDESDKKQTRYDGGKTGYCTKHHVEFWPNRKADETKPICDDWKP